MVEALKKNKVPYWTYRNLPEDHKQYYEIFSLFVSYIWNHLGLPEPTLAQKEIAHRLQYGADSFEWQHFTNTEKQVLLTKPRTDIIEAFRGLGKSYIAACFTIWRLLRNPRDEKILVISATGDRAKQFVSQVKNIIQSTEVCQWLLNGNRANNLLRRNTSDSFDVTFSSISQSYSVRSASLTGQITGFRATCIIADDIEIPSNSMTVDARKKIISTIQSDFGPIAMSEHGIGDIFMLGTPQTEESIYNYLVTEMDYKCFTIPIRYPMITKLYNYELRKNTGPVNVLAPYLYNNLNENPNLSGNPTDIRFDEEEIIQYELKSQSKFLLQYMLDTTLSNIERYPLKLKNFIVLSLNKDKAPVSIQWGHDSDKKNYIHDLPNFGFTGDYYLRPLFVDKQWNDYEYSIMFVDPSGRGLDETSWAIIKVLHGTMFILDINGFQGEISEALQKVAITAKNFNVQKIIVEPNFGGDVWLTALQPVILKVIPNGVSLESAKWVRTHKETRIIDILEPALGQHRLVLNEQIIHNDIQLEDKRYSSLYQISRITRHTNSLTYDDRVDALAGAVSYCKDNLAIDVEQALETMKEEEFWISYYKMLEFQRHPGRITAEDGSNEFALINI